MNSTTSNLAASDLAASAMDTTDSTEHLTYRSQTGAFWLHQIVKSRLQILGAHVIRYGLALVIVWIGFMKFTAYEAQGIEPLVASSPLMGWIYGFLSVRDFSAALGIVETSIAALIALRPWFPKASAVGSAAAVFMFLTTPSFLFSAPGWETTLGGFPALSASIGQFLVKDLVLLGAAIWTCGEAYSATQGDISEPIHESN